MVAFISVVLHVFALIAGVAAGIGWGKYETEAACYVLMFAVVLMVCALALGFAS